jgi:hypothetical protein
VPATYNIPHFYSQEILLNVLQVKQEYTPLSMYKNKLNTTYTMLRIFSFSALYYQHLSRHCVLTVMQFSLTCHSSIQFTSTMRMNAFTYQNVPCFMEPQGSQKPASHWTQISPHHTSSRYISIFYSHLCLISQEVIFNEAF